VVGWPEKIVDPPTSEESPWPRQPLSPLRKTRQSFAKTRARQQLHAYLDGWLIAWRQHAHDTPQPGALTQACFPCARMTAAITQPW